MVMLFENKIYYILFRDSPCHQKKERIHLTNIKENSCCFLNSQTRKRPKFDRACALLRLGREGNDQVSWYDAGSAP